MDELRVRSRIETTEWKILKPATVKGKTLQRREALTVVYFNILTNENGFNTGRLGHSV